MNIDQLTIAEAREIAAMFNNCSPPAGSPGTARHPFKVGEKYMVRTVTYIITGKLDRVVGGFLVLVDAAWVADTGRYMNAVATGEFSEVEPYPDGIEVPVGMGAIIDACVIPTLPRSQK